MSDKLMFARVLNLDYLNSFDQNQLDLSENDVTKNINNLTVSMEDNHVHLRWNDCVNSSWKKSYIVKAENSIPTSVYNGNIVTSYTEKNKYSTVDFIDNDISENVLYCYRVFSEFDNDSKYYSGFKNIFYVYVASVTMCDEDHELGSILATKIVTDPKHRFVTDIQMLSWDNKSEFDGDYESLENKPSFATIALSGDYNDLLNKPSFATVATSGNYVDLTNKPDVYLKSETYNKEEVDTLIQAIDTECSFSGDYVDLTNKPDIYVKTETYNKEEVDTLIANINTECSFSGSYNDLTDKPNVYVKTETYSKQEVNTLIANINTECSFSGSYNDLTDKPQLVTVATSGSYNDLTNKPDIYNKKEIDNLLEGVSNGSDFSGSYNDLTDKPQLATVATSGSYDDLTNKPNVYQKAEVYNKTEVDTLIEDVKTLIPEDGGSNENTSNILRYVPEGAQNGDCYVLATKPGITFTKVDNVATLVVPEGTELLSIQVRFSSVEIGTKGKCVLNFGKNFNFTDNLCIPTYVLVNDTDGNRVAKLGQAMTMGTNPNAAEFPGLAANIGVIIKVTF